MAEAIGLAASIIQVAQLGLSCTQTLYTFSKSVRNSSKSISRLTLFVESNHRLLTRLGGLLEDTPALNDSIQADLFVAVSSCRAVFAEIESLFSSASSQVSGVKKLVQKTKYAAFSEAQVERLRAELAQCQGSLNLMLLIHWKPRDWQADVQITLKEGLAQALRSEVPSIRAAVRECLLEIASATEGLSSGGDDTGTTAGNVATTTVAAGMMLAKMPSGRDVETASPPPALSSTPSESSATLLGRQSTLASSDTNESGLTTKSIMNESRSNTDPVSTDKVKTMWHAQVSARKKLTFEKQHLSQDLLDKFVLDKALDTVANMPSLDPSIMSQINQHLERLSAELLALQLHRKAVFGVSRLQSMQLVTAMVTPAPKKPSSALRGPHDEPQAASSTFRRRRRFLNEREEYSLPIGRSATDPGLTFTSPKEVRGHLTQADLSIRRMSRPDSAHRRLSAKSDKDALDMRHGGRATTESQDEASEQGANSVTPLASAYADEIPGDSFAMEQMSSEGAGEESMHRIVSLMETDSSPVEAQEAVDDVHDGNQQLAHAITNARRRRSMMFLGLPLLVPLKDRIKELPLRRSRQSEVIADVDIDAANNENVVDENVIDEDINYHALAAELVRKLGDRWQSAKTGSEQVALNP